LTPKGLDNFSALLSVSHAESESGQVQTNIPQSGSPFDQRLTTNNDPRTINSDTDLVSLDLEYELNDHWSLSTITTYSDVTSSQIDIDLDGGNLESIIGTSIVNTDTFSQELRLTFEHEKLKGIVGAYYFDQNINTENAGQTRVFLANAGLTVPFLIGGFGLDMATAGFVLQQFAPVDPAILNNRSTTSRSIESFALFADVRYELNDKWDIYGGIRWDNEDQINDSNSVLEFANVGDLPDPANFPSPLNQLIGGVNQFILAAADTANRNIPLTDSNIDEILPKLGISYHWTQDISTSFTAQRGFRTGGVGVNIFRAEPFDFDSEFTDNYELSFRSSWLDDTLTVNANVFYLDWEDQQVSVQLSEASLDNQTVNAGSSTVRGFELEVNYQASEHITVFGSLGQAKTNFEEFDVSIPNADGTLTEFDLSGRSFADAPEWTANIGGTYRQDNGFFVNLNANYAEESNAVTNPFNNGLVAGDEGFDLQNDSRVLVNAQVGYEWNEGFGVYLIASNLLDEEYVSLANPNAFSEDRVFTHTLGDPRQLSVSLRGRF